MRSSPSLPPCFCPRWAKPAAWRKELNARRLRNSWASRCSCMSTTIRTICPGRHSKSGASSPTGLISWRLTTVCSIIPHRNGERRTDLSRHIRCKGQGAENVTNPYQVYMYNATIGGESGHWDTTGSFSSSPKKLTSLRYASRVLAFTDSIYGEVDKNLIPTPFLQNFCGQTTYWWTNPFGNCTVGYSRHLMSANFLFTDGHVEVIPAPAGNFTLSSSHFLCQ